MISSSPLVIFEDLSVELGGVSILNLINGSIPVGSSTAIVGPNGAGKTTLLLALLGEIPYRGKIVYASGKSPRVGYVPQKLHFDRGTPLTVVEFLAMGMQRTPLWLGVGKRHRAYAMELLGWVQEENIANQAMGTLSGGELQRVLLAMALQRDPELLILDEPVAGVDFHGEMIFCELLEKLREERKYTQLMVSHDLAMVSHHANYVICLNRRVISAGPPEKVLTSENLAEAFGIHMGTLFFEKEFNHD